jgi:acyl-coenzyme A synthetase/AMP-(fatty) acid ligase
VACKPDIAVVPREALNERQLIRWCAERNLPGARIFSVESLPKTTLGKINRELLKRELAGPALNAKS